MEGDGLFVVRHLRRKVEVCDIVIDPDKEFGEGEGGGVAALCGGPPGVSKLDF